MNMIIRTVLILGIIQLSTLDALNIFRIQDDLPADQLIGTIDYSFQPNLIGYINQQLSLEFRLQRATKLPASLFRIDPDNGRIFSQKVIDREELCRRDSEFFVENSKYSSDCQFDLQVMISVKDSARIPEFLDVKVIIDDRNDHLPVFNPNLINLSLPEDAVPGTKIKLPQASDKDSSQYSISNYSLENSENSEVWTLDIKREQRMNSDVFAITELYLELRGVLDREKITNYQLKVIALDTINPQMGRNSHFAGTDTNVLTINLTIEDVNDNKPNFVKPESDYLDKYDIREDLSTFHLIINESENIKNPIIHIRAEDRDLALLDNMRFLLMEQNSPHIKSMFNLSQNGQLFVNKKFDHEEHAEHIINFYVTDSQSNEEQNKLSPSEFMHRVRGQIKITVLDKNDEIPRIEVEYFNTEGSGDFATVNENSKPGKFLGSVIVEDRDVKNDFSDINCQIFQYYGSFGGKSNKKTDEHGSGVQLVEHSKVPGRIHYNLVTDKTFDREEREIYQYRFICKDSSVEPNEISHIITLKILDENDNAPELKVLQIDEIGVYENSPVGTRVGKVLVIDKDKGVNARVNLEIIPEYNSQTLNAMETFNVDSMTGEITTKIQIDREGITPPLTSIPVVIRASDGGSPSLTSQIALTVKIFDENDNKPEFHICPMHFYVKENEPAGICVGEISVFDLDQNINNLNMRIKQFGLPFKVWSPTGMDFGQQRYDQSEKRFYLNTTQSLDRERKASYEFSILAIDSGSTGLYNRSISHTSSCDIFVNIEDTNDNDPVILIPQSDNKTYLLSNKELINFAILSVKTKDLDLVNDQFVHELTYLGTLDRNVNETVENFLQIDATSGIVRLIRNMKETDNGNYLFRVKVNDTGIPPRQSQVYFIVKVTDMRAKSNHRINLFNSLGDQTSELQSRTSGLLRFGNDGILILALGLVLLLLLATLGLILFARSWHITNGPHGNSSFDRCLRYFMCCFTPNTMPIGMSQSNIRSDYLKSIGSLKYPVQYEIQSQNGFVPNSIYGVMDPTYQVNRNRLLKRSDPLLLKPESYDTSNYIDDASMDSNLANYKYYASSTTIPAQTQNNTLTSDRYATLAHDGSKFIIQPNQLTKATTPNVLQRNCIDLISEDTSSSAASLTAHHNNNLYQTLQSKQSGSQQVMILDPSDIKPNNVDNHELINAKTVTFSQSPKNDCTNPWSSYV